MRDETRAGPAARSGARAPVTVRGHAHPAFAPVAAAFQRILGDKDELGASFSAVLEGQCVVDIWGGVAERHAAVAWTRHTRQVMFSGSKGLVATCLLLLIERGQLDLDSPMTRYWPGFAPGSSSPVLVRHVVSHTSGLFALQTPVDAARILDDIDMERLVSGQRPTVPPGEQLIYHPLTFGWLCGGLVRRIDGRSIGRFFREDIAAPLGLDIWIGLPAEEERRTGGIDLSPEWGRQPHLAEQTLTEDGLMAATWANPPLFTRGALRCNERAWHAAEIPAVNAIGTARSMARLYACLARGGTLDGRRLLSDDTLRLARRSLSRGRDPFIGLPAAFGVGFALQTGLRQFGPPRTAFGHGGAGGSVHGAWPDHGLGFSYLPNLLRDDDVDERAQALLAALFECVDREGDRLTTRTPGSLRERDPEAPSRPHPPRS